MPTMSNTVFFSRIDLSLHMLVSGGLSLSDASQALTASTFALPPSLLSVMASHKLMRLPFDGPTVLRSFATAVSCSGVPLRFSASSA